MAHVNDGHLGLYLRRVSCLAAMEPETGGGGGVMANREARWPLFHVWWNE
jgi:hypothetical protein